MYRTSGPVDRTDAAPGIVSPGRPAPSPRGTGYDYDRDDPTFVADLSRSDLAVEAVGRWYRQHGRGVYLPETRVRPTPAARRAYQDRGDLYVLERVPVTWRRVEVRWRWGMPFTSPADYPGRRRTVLLKDCAVVDAAAKVPWRYVVCNADLTVGLVVDVAATRAAWTRVTFTNRTSGRLNTVYACPRELTTAIALPPRGGGVAS